MFQRRTWLFLRLWSHAHHGILKLMTMTSSLTKITKGPMTTNVITFLNLQGGSFYGKQTNNNFTVQTRTELIPSEFSY